MSDLFDFSSLVPEQKSGFDLSKYTSREKIEILEWLIAHYMDNIADDLPVTHNIYGGMYEREIFQPKDVVIIGKIHKADHIFMLLEGDLSIMTDEGMKRIQAPYKFNVRSGIKKIGYAHTDVRCTTIHKTDLTELDKIEESIFQDSDLSWVDIIMLEDKSS